MGKGVTTGARVTPDQLAPIIKARLKKALARHAPEHDVDTWQQYEADRLGVAAATFRNWYHGYELPTLQSWGALLYRYEGLHAEIFDGIPPTKEERTNERLNAVASSLRDLADDIESGLVTQPVPLRGKIS